MKNKWIQYLLTIVCVSLVALSILLSPSTIRPKSYEELIADTPPIYTGVIHIWMISSWRVAQSSKTICMLDVANKFESQNPFVYIEVINMSQQEYQDNISHGIYPDVLSFPAEMSVELDMCASLPVFESLLPIHQQSHTATYAKTVPWIATSNICILSSKKADKLTLDISRHQSSDQIAATIDVLADNDSYTLGSPFALIPLAVSSASIGTTPADITPYNAWISFVSKETNLIYGCIWQSYSMDRLIDRGKGFDVEYIYPSVDMPRFLWTQNLCVFSQNPNKNIMINEYIDMLLSDKYQIKIADSTASYPVTNVTLDYQGVRREILSNTDQSQMVIVPGIGIAVDEIASALADQPNAKTALQSKLIIE